MNRPTLAHIMSCFFATIVGIVLLSTPSFATQGCCSNHGGVAGCNKATGYLLCKDGTTSPTCKCEEGATTTKAKHETSHKGIIGTLFGTEAAKKTPKAKTTKTETPKAKSEKAKSEKAKSEKAKAEKAKSEKAKATKAKATKGKTKKPEKPKKQKPKTPKTKSTTT